MCTVVSSFVRKQKSFSMFQIFFLCRYF
uniref:Uncharacterized protein n=1 Tax=Arundo donax TaxID=35708 RepID=A0A0A8YNB3_ARUDO